MTPTPKTDAIRDERRSGSVESLCRALIAHANSLERENVELRKALEPFASIDLKADVAKLETLLTRVRDEGHGCEVGRWIPDKLETDILDCVRSITAPAQAPKPIDDNSVPVPAQVQQTIDDKFFDLLDAPKPRTCGECASIHTCHCPFPDRHGDPCASCESFRPSDGGPAFPETEHIHDPRASGVISHSGMTLRDYFAAKALQGMLSAHMNCSTIEQVTKAAYQLADAMLEARRRNQSQPPTTQP